MRDSSSKKAKAGKLKSRISFMTMISFPGSDAEGSNDLRWEFGMALSPRAVSIKQLPEKLDQKRGRIFLRELERSMNVERPSIVLDCSRVREMDLYAVHLLLCCLEGAIKRNGDVRLAAVAPAALLNLELAGLDRLFRIFATVDDAVESFQRRIAHVVPHGVKPDDGRGSSRNAAW